MKLTKTTIGISLLVLAGAGAGYYFMFGKGKSAKSTTPATKTETKEEVIEQIKSTATSKGATVTAKPNTGNLVFLVKTKGGFVITFDTRGDLAHLKGKLAEVQNLK